MNLIRIIRLLGGVALFLFGMNFMGDGLKRLSGDKLEPVLYRLSNTRLKGVLLGAGVTAVIQSSCATSVMAVGFVNSGMMRARQGMNVILGSILGTSVTGWVICLSYIEGTSGLGGALSALSLTSLMAMGAVLLRAAGRRESVRNIGDILMGFAILMFGMSTMSGAVDGLGENSRFTAMLTGMAGPLTGVLAGAAFTAVLQSASAAVGILQALSVTGAISLGEALPLLLGINVGASVPVLLSALGASAEGRRTAFSYLILSAAGAAVCGALYYGGDVFFPFSFAGKIMDPFSMALMNTTLRLVMVVSLLPLMGRIERVMTLLIQEKKADRFPAAEEMETTG